MTKSEAFALDCCPVCGFPLLKNKNTGLVACSAPAFNKCGFVLRFNVVFSDKKVKARK